MYVWGFIISRLLITCRDSIITNMISQKGVWELAGCRQDNYQNDWKERFCRVESSDVSPLSLATPTVNCWSRDGLKIEWF